MLPTDNNEMGSDHGLHVAPTSVDAAAIDELPLGSAMHVAVDDAEVLLANVNGSVVAVADICLCCGTPLSEAAFLCPLLVCRKCGWQYDLKRGEVVGLSALKLVQYLAWLEGERVYVAAPRVTPT